MQDRDVCILLLDDKKVWVVGCVRFFFLMIRRPPRSTQSGSSAASDVYKRQGQELHSTTRMVHSYALGKLAGQADCDAMIDQGMRCLLYTSPSPRDRTRSRMPSSA